MLRPTYLLTSTVLAAVTAVSLLSPASGVKQVSQVSQPLSIQIERASLPTQTISSQVISAPASPQRWVF
jgi:hypothetical protein